MDFTPLFQEIMKAGPWALVCLLMVWFVWSGLSAAWKMMQPVFANIIDAHLSYLRSVADGQDRIHEVLDSQTHALQQNNQILGKLSEQLQQHQDVKMSILQSHTDMLRAIGNNLNHRT
jgi:predicted PurR-regulated permease PerM